MKFTPPHMTRPRLIGGMGIAAVLAAAVAVLVLYWPAQTFAQPGGGDSGPVKVRAIPQFPSVPQGGKLVIALEMAHDEGFHSWPAKEVKLPAAVDELAIRTEVTLAKSKSQPSLPKWLAKFDGTQYPEAHNGKVSDPTGEKPTIEVPLYSGKAVSYLRFELKPDAPLGDQTIEVQASYQSCNESMCTPPMDAVVAVKVKVVAKGTTDLGAPNEPTLFEKFDSTRWSQAPAAAADAWTFDFLGWKFEVEQTAYWLILPIAFIAGFLLNLTPCVLPVIPIKVLSLQQQAEKPAKLALYGTVYCIGIVATFLVLGLMIFGLVFSSQKQDWGQIFTNPWFTGAMAIVVAALGLGMFGLYTIRLPQHIYALNPTHDTVTGNFLMGVLTAVLSTPCTGPLLGATVAWSATQPAWVGLATFVVMGIGMASPYALLIVFPHLIDKMPRSGPGGELLKQVLGILMLSVAAFLAGNLTPDAWPWYVIGGLACLSFGWAIVGGWRVLRARGTKVWVTAFSLLAIAGTVWMTRAMVDEGPIPWTRLRQPADAAIHAAIDRARQKGEVVVIDFTAKWCLNCHVIEKTILNSADGQALLTSKGVAPVRVDLGNSRDGNGWGVVREISGGGGIPLVAVFGPGASKPIYFQSFFKVSDLEAAVKAQRTAERPASDNTRG